MKQCLIVFVLLFFTFAELHAQSSADLSEEGVKQILCKKWVISRITISGVKVNSLGVNTTYEFKPDHTVVCIWEKGKKKGKWSYDSTNNTVYITLRKKQHLYLKSLSADEFEIASQTDDSEEKLLEPNFYFKPEPK